MPPKLNRIALAFAWSAASLPVAAQTLPVKGAVASAKDRADCRGEQPSLLISNDSTTNNSATTNSSAVNIHSTANNSTNKTVHTVAAAVAPAKPAENVLVYCGDHASGGAELQATALAYNLGLQKGEAKDKGKDAEDSPMWKAIEKLAPFFQSALWVAFCVFIVYKFNDNLKSLLEQIKIRLSEGGGFETPWFKLLPIVRPLSADAKAEKAEAEAQEAFTAAPNKSTISNFMPVAAQTYMEAEELAIRALRIMYGENIMRDVETDTGFRMDGYFIKDRRPYIVEVKLLQAGASLNPLRKSLERLLDRIIKDRIVAPKVVLAVVFMTPEESDERSREIQEALGVSRDTVDLRFFSLPELRRDFGERRG